VGSRLHQLEMIRALNTMDMRPVIDALYPLARIVEAFQFQKSGRHFGKNLHSVLTPCRPRAT
jgi:NADPH:quinone reductase-like Zn-dependent oxidoreductase